MKRVKNVKQVGVRQSLLLAGLILAGFATSHTALAAPAIVGSWHVDYPDVQAVATFLEDGTYFEAIDVAGDSVHTGIEWGTLPIHGMTSRVKSPLHPWAIPTGTGGLLVMWMGLSTCRLRAMSSP